MKKKQQKRAKRNSKAPSQPVVNPLVTAFAVRMKEWRLGKGLTLKTVAAKTGLSISILCEWEHGYRFPSVDHLWAIAQYTGIPAGELIRPVKGSASKKTRAR